MHRTRLCAAALAAALIAALPLAVAPADVQAAAPCGSYSSEVVPPPVIRVFRTATGTVETVDFRAYVKNVLSREWISSWTPESLRAGALAVKHYAWYQVLHHRGYANAAGECFDVFDSTRDQHYDPGRPTYASMVTAVDATWETLVLRGGRVIPTYYHAGAASEPCGANANGWRMSQWGSQACGQAGRSAAEILGIYYAGIAVSAAPVPVTPAPTAPPTPAPPPPVSPVPLPSGSPPVAPPSPAPVPAPPAPPTPLAQPGGGQAGLVAPPPPPVPHPAPVVVASGGTLLTTLASQPPRDAPAAATAVPKGPASAVEDQAALAFEAAADERSARPRRAWHAGLAISQTTPAVRLAGVRFALERWLEMTIGRLLPRWLSPATAAAPPTGPQPRPGSAVRRS